MIREFVSFPKSGRTWIRYLLGQLGVDREIAFHHDRFEFNDGAKPAHDFDLASRLAHYRNVDRLVYLERDPRDVMVSLYHQVTGRFREFFGYPAATKVFKDVPRSGGYYQNPDRGHLGTPGWLILLIAQQVQQKF